MRKTVTLCLLCIGLSAAAGAEVKLPNVLSDHAVLQRDKPVRIWGWGDPGERVTVRFHNQSLSAQTDGFGSWTVFLMSEPAGGPYTLTVTGDRTAKPLVRTDLLIGDVWIASGQSNMAMPLKGFRDTMRVKNGQAEIAAASHPEIRLLLQSRRTSEYPLEDTDSTWKLCTPEIAQDFSAVAYFFGRDISQQEHVPVGIVDTTWGGTPAQAWLSFQGIGYENLSSVYAESGRLAAEQAHNTETKAIWEAEDAADRALGRPVPSHPLLIDHMGSWLPAALFNGMVAPFTRYTIRGVIFYQGESDALPFPAGYYGRVFSALIRDWRRQWQQGPFPFLYVQIASFDRPADDWGAIREAQRRTLDIIDTGMAVTLDVGLPHNIHPPDKQTVGARLALAARGVAYGDKIEYASPNFVEATTEGNAMRVWFSDAEGLTTHGQPLGGFEIAGTDHKFVPADASFSRLDGQDTVVVHSDKVPQPRFVRYGWSNVVTSYFYNSAGLPASTFTSEP